MCVCEVTAVVLVNTHNIEMISSFHTVCVCEIAYMFVCLCVCLSSPVSVEFSTVSWFQYVRLVKKPCCMPKSGIPNRIPHM